MSATAPQPETATAPQRKRQLVSRRNVLIALAVVLVLAIAGWVAFGVTIGRVAALESSQAASVEAAAGLEDDLARVKEQRDGLQESRDDLTRRESEADTRERQLDARESELDAREEQLDEEEAYVQETSLSDGTYTVGVSMEAGTYRTESTSTDCYWAIYRSGTNYDDIVNNDIPGTGVITVSVSAGQDFRTQRCGTWELVD